MEKRERFLAALEGKPVDRPPVWLMRQAGRYLSGYRAVRAEHGFWDVCHNPELSTQVALEPLNKFALDAAIVFSDILVIPEALGLGVTFGKGEGPQLARPLRSPADLDAWKIDGIGDRLTFLPAAVKHLSFALNGSHGLMGFAGAPWTLFSYITEGQGSDDFRTARVMMYEQPALVHKTLALLAEIVASLCDAECAAGADAVQLFDTWGGLLTADEYATFCIPALRRITEALHARNRKVLLFVRGGHHLLPLLGESGADGFSLDWRTSFSQARALYPKHLLQGNLDPILLLSKPAVVEKAIQKLLAEVRGFDNGARTILNLGHGILPGTPTETVEALVNTVVNSRG